MSKRSDTPKNVETFLSLDVGASATFPLNMYNTIRGLRYFNPQILAARAEGRTFAVRTDVNNKCVVLTRTT